MPLKLNSSGGGSVTLDTPSTASTYTLTVPAITGTAVVTGSSGTVSQGMLASGVAGNGPAFSAVPNATQSIANQTFTKLTFADEEYDTASCYNNATNYRFTPNIAGYYLVTIKADIPSSVAAAYIYIYKNGSAYRVNNINDVSNTISAVSITSYLYLNGSTDYIEAYLWQSSGGAVNVSSGGVNNYFQASLVRAA
jgi:hypothetical protein